jgi:serine phosphatase RsbU (regulator of sigma subunit)
MVEAHNSHHEMFGLPRLHESLANVALGPGTIDYLLGCLAEFTGTTWEQEDDVTFVVLHCDITLSPSIITK